MTKFYGWPVIVASFAVAAVASILHCSLLSGARLWTHVMPSLYCIPVMLAAINIGIRAALGVALASSLSHVVASLLGCGDLWPASLIEAILYFAIALAAAKLTRMHSALAVAQGPSDRAARPAPGFGQIIAGVINRFRTPVASITGAVDLLEDQRFPREKRQEFVRIIQHESQELDRALSDVLEFTQPRKPQWQRVDLSHLVDKVIERVRPKEPWPFFLFLKEIPPGLPHIKCDPDQISKVLLNLLTNAIQATPGGGQIVIAAYPEDDEVVITVKDHGRGIAPAIAGRIFDPFFTDRDNGLGLGLTLARQIVSSHCGTISVIGSSDQGTAVTVRLPLNPTEAHEHRPHIGG